MHNVKNTRQRYASDRMKEFAMNINDFELGELVIDVNDGSQARITEKSKNTVRLFLSAKTKKGIDCYGWFDMKAFNKRFTKKL